jgi:hypothetical protein
VLSLEAALTLGRCVRSACALCRASGHSGDALRTD